MPKPSGADFSERAEHAARVAARLARGAAESRTPEALHRTPASARPTPRGEPAGLPRRSADATAADHLLRNVPVVALGARAAEARRAALESAASTRVYVVSEAGGLAGVLPITALLAISDDEPIAAHLDPAPPTVSADADQEHVAFAAIRHDLAAVPIVDAAGRFMGVVPVSNLLNVLHHEHIEDLDRLSGILRRREHVNHALDESPSRRVRERLPWLLVGLVGSALATWLVAAFETSLARSVVVAFFMPGIVYLADAIGTQTEAVAIRALSFQRLDARRVFWGELRTGFLLGLVLAAPVFGSVWWIFGSRELAAAVGLAILVAGTVASAVGFAFPLLLARFNRDPAFGSGPLATVVQDGLSLLAYFLAVQLFLPS